MLDGSFLVVHVPILEMESFEPTCSTNGQLILFLKRRTAKKFFKKKKTKKKKFGPVMGDISGYCSISVENSRQ